MHRGGQPGEMGLLGAMRLKAGVSRFCHESLSRPILQPFEPAALAIFRVQPRREVDVARTELRVGGAEHQALVAYPLHTVDVGAAKS